MNTLLRRGAIGATAALFATAGVASAGKKEAWFRMGGVELLVARGVEAKESPGVDWRSFHFTARGKRELLFLYLGDAPRFPSKAPASVKEEAGAISGLASRNVRWTGEDGKRHREVLVDRGSKVYPFRMLHFLYTGLTTAEAETADGMIASLREAAEPEKRK